MLFADLYLADELEKLSELFNDYEKRRDINYHTLFWYWYFKVFLLYINGVTEKAIEHLKNVRKNVYKQPPFLYAEMTLTLGQFYISLGEKEKAQPYLQEALKYFRKFNENKAIDWLSQFVEEY